jgi:D-psicose/D-tagatose/L-ribulose 3-epimerase
MRFGANTWAFTFPFRSPEGDSLVDRMADLGCDHFGLGAEALDEPGAIDLRSLRDRLSSRKMTSAICSIFGPDRDLSSLDPSIRRMGADYLRQCIDAASELGASIVAGAFCGAGGRGIPSTAERQARVDVATVELRNAGEYAATVNVRLAVEPLNRYENNLVNTIDHARPIIEGVAHPNVGFHIDLFHANIEEVGVGAAIRSAGTRLINVDAVDTNRGAPGSGHLAWQEVAAAFVDIGYEGALMIESFAPDSWIASAASMWRPFAESQDALVGDGIKFLRGVIDAARTERDQARAPVG